LENLVQGMQFIDLKNFTKCNDAVLLSKNIEKYGDGVRPPEKFEKCSVGCKVLAWTGEFSM
jgi:hypothetical protein